MNCSDSVVPVRGLCFLQLSHSRSFSSDPRIGLAELDDVPPTSQTLTRTQPCTQHINHQLSIHARQAAVEEVCVCVETYHVYMQYVFTHCLVE